MGVGTCGVTRAPAFVIMSLLFLRQHQGHDHESGDRERRPRMSVSVRIPTILRTFTGGSAEVSADPGTLREVLASLDTAYPGLAGRIIDDAGNLRRFVNVYVGDEDVRFAKGLDTPVPAGSRVSVIPAVAGG